jgi:hypothetical protein
VKINSTNANEDIKKGTIPNTNSNANNNNINAHNNYATNVKIEDTFEKLMEFHSQKSNDPIIEDDTYKLKRHIQEPLYN